MSDPISEERISDLEKTVKQLERRLDQQFEFIQDQANSIELLSVALDVKTNFVDYIGANANAR